MKRQAIIGFFILVSVCSINAQNISSATQVVTFGVRSSITRQAANAITATMYSTTFADLKGSSELQVRAASGKKVTYRSNRLPTNFSGFRTPTAVSYEHRRSPQFRDERGLIITITD